MRVLTLSSHNVLSILSPFLVKIEAIVHSIPQLKKNLWFRTSKMIGKRLFSSALSSFIICDMGTALALASHKLLILAIPAGFVGYRKLSILHGGITLYQELENGYSIHLSIGHGLRIVTAQCCGCGDLLEQANPCSLPQLSITSKQIPGLEISRYSTFQMGDSGMATLFATFSGQYY